MHGFTGCLVMLLPMVSLATQGCPEAIQSGISHCFYSKIFITKTSARSQLTRRSETEEAEDADEDRCAAKSDIVPAMTWDGIQGLYTIHRPREWDVYNLTIYHVSSSFHFAGKHQFSENPSLSSVPCRCMSVPRGDESLNYRRSAGKVTKFP